MHTPTEWLYLEQNWPTLVQGQNNTAHPEDPEPQLRRTQLQRFTEGLQRVLLMSSEMKCCRQRELL